MKPPTVRTVAATGQLASSIRDAIEIASSNTPPAADPAKAFKRAQQQFDDCGHGHCLSAAADTIIYEHLQCSGASFRSEPLARC